MNAILDRRAAQSEASAGLLGSRDATQRGREHRRRDDRSDAGHCGIDTASRSPSALIQGADGVFSVLFAGALLCVSVSFSILLIAAMLIVFLCGLACYS
jgi:hypothetical protein